MSEPKVLVTGATGFLGTHLCEALADAGWEVHATTRRSVPTPGGAVFHRADLSDFEATARVLELVRPEIVFHLAGAVGASPDIANLRPTLDSHVTSAVNLLQLAGDSSVRRLILTGSLLEPDGDAPPSSPYAAAKKAMTRYAKMCHELYGTPATVVRPFMTYGPRQRADKVIPYVIRKLLAEETPLLSSGNWRADWIFVDDVTKGFLAAAEAPDIEGRDLDLGCGRFLSLREVVNAVCAEIDGVTVPEFGAIGDRPAEPERAARVTDSEKMLGWRPTVELGEGVRRTVAWYRNHRADSCM